MEKRCNFPKLRINAWPAPGGLAPLFLEHSRQCDLWSGGNDNWGLSIAGLDGTAHLPPKAVLGRGRDTQIEARLSIWANPNHGALVYYQKISGKISIHRFSLGNMTRIKEWVRTTHDDLRPIGLYVPLETAWPAVKQFMETDGRLPTLIDWIKPEELPIGTFPDPWEHPEVT